MIVSITTVFRSIRNQVKSNHSWRTCTWWVNTWLERIWNDLQMNRKSVRSKCAAKTNSAATTRDAASPSSGSATVKSTAPRTLPTSIRLLDAVPPCRRINPVRPAEPTNSAVSTAVAYSKYIDSSRINPLTYFWFWIPLSSLFNSFMFLMVFSLF